MPNNFLVKFSGEFVSGLVAIEVPLFAKGLYVVDSENAEIIRRSIYFGQMFGLLDYPTVMNNWLFYS